uniref:Uncharacterized protein n=1 Tax=Hippocampus comes TaxID=109280 RepID=A0A3Q3D235_HIPCM
KVRYIFFSSNAVSQFDNRRHCCFDLVLSHLKSCVFFSQKYSQIKYEMSGLLQARACKSGSAGSGFNILGPGWVRLDSLLDRERCLHRLNRRHFYRERGCTAGLRLCHWPPRHCRPGSDSVHLVASVARSLPCNHHG